MESMDQTATGGEVEQKTRAARAVKKTRQRRTRTAKPPADPVESAMAMPEAFDRQIQESVAQQKIDPPRVSHWVCRESVVWNRPLDGAVTSVSYQKGDVIEVGFADHEKPHRFDYAREFWFPEGYKIVDPHSMMVIPKQFEPFDPDGKAATLRLWNKVLVDPRKLNYARGNIAVGKVGTPFHFKHELKLHDMNLEDIPEPIDPTGLVKPPDIPDRFNPSELSVRTGIRG